MFRSSQQQHLQGRIQSEVEGQKLCPFLDRQPLSDFTALDEYRHIPLLRVELSISGTAEMSTEPPTSKQLVTTTWALTESSRDVLSVSRGIMQAATSDNVQVIALAAAEAFGATIAMSQRTLMVTEKSASRRDTSAVLEFLQAQIGWSTYDSAYQLASSDAGLRFLGLTAVLITARNPLHGAETVETLMRNTAGKNQILPTLGQVMDLINAIRPKMCQARFADKIVGAEILLTGLLGPQSHGTWYSLAGAMPGPQQIAELVSAFAKVKRIGTTEDNFDRRGSMRLNITATSGHAWLFAFAEWCLGGPPDIIGPDGRMLLEQPDHDDVHVTLYLNLGVVEAQSEVLVDIQYAIDQPKELWTAPSAQTESWVGFVSIANYGQHHLRYLGLAEGFSFTAVHYAVAYYLCCIQRRAVPAGIKEEFADYMSQVLPSRPRIETIFSLYMGRDMPPRVESLVATGRPVHQLPIVLTQLEALRAQCHCRQCNDRTDSPLYEYCVLSNLQESIAPIAFDILAIACLESVDQVEPLLDISSLGIARFRDAKISKALESFAKQPAVDIVIKPFQICRRALRLFGMPVKENYETWLVTSHAGQVLYPSILDAPHLDGRFIYRLKCYRGQLEYRRERYSLVTGAGGIHGSSSLSSEAVDTIRDLTSDDNTALTWMTTRRVDHLELSVGLASHVEDPSHFFRYHPMALYLNRCPHDPDHPLPAPDGEAVFVTPRPTNPDPRFDVQVVPVAGNDAKRFFAFANVFGVKAVVRGQACLGCCLALCRRAAYEVVIL